MGFDQGADIFLLCIRIQLDVQPTVDRLSEGDLIKKRDINDIIIIAITRMNGMSHSRTRGSPT